MVQLIAIHWWSWSKRFLQWTRYEMPLCTTPSLRSRFSFASFAELISMQPLPQLSALPRHQLLTLRFTKLEWTMRIDSTPLKLCQNILREGKVNNSLLIVCRLQFDWWLYIQVPVVVSVEPRLYCMIRRGYYLLLAFHYWKGPTVLKDTTVTLLYISKPRRKFRTKVGFPDAFSFNICIL